MAKVNFLLLIAFFISGCATIVNDDFEPINISSDPPGAKVTHHAKSCVTPCTLEIPREGNTDIIFESPGYEKSSYKIGSVLDGWFWANLISFSWIGMLVDYSNGRGKKPSPANIYLAMRPVNGKELPTLADEDSEDLDETPAVPLEVSVTRPSPEQFEKSINKRPEKKDILFSDDQSFPMGWPEKWYYETKDYRYWTIVGERKTDQSEAIVSSKQKAEKIIQVEFPSNRFKTPFPYESTHMEIKRINGQFQSWRIIRIKQKDAALLKK